MLPCAIGSQTGGRPLSAADEDRALAHLAALWRAERATVQARAVEQRRALTLAERIARGMAARDLVVDETDAAPGGRTLLWIASRRSTGELETLRAGPGDPVRLWWDDPDGADAVRGVISRRRGDRLAVMVDDAPDRLLDEGFRLDLDDPLETFARGDRAIARFRQAPPGDLRRLRAVLLGDREPEFEAEPAVTPFDEGLNAPQRAAVARCLAARDVALVHGPPGTGKTRTLVEVIRQAVLRGERVLATAASNAAVDNLAERLAAGVDVVRLGHPARVAPAVQERTLDSQLARTDARRLARKWVAEANAIRRKAQIRFDRGAIGRSEKGDLLREAGRLQKDARIHLRRVEQAIVSRAAVVCATAAGADAALLPDEPFDLVVLDEATQAVDPVALVALARGRRVVMAGDPCQLPPTVVDLDAARAGLGRTIFERLADAGRGDPLRLLTVQHRMNEAIMAFPSDRWYGGRLVAAPSVAHHTVEDLGAEPDPLRPGPLVLVDTAGKGWEERRAGDDPSTSNPRQGERTAAEVRRLLSRGVAPADVAVITPYDAQVRLLRELLDPEVRQGVEVGTVDGFQGREKEAILVDLVRSNDEGQIGFLADSRRLNVALTRARRLLLIVGDSATVANDATYGALIESVEAFGVVVSAWTDEAPPLGGG